MPELADYTEKVQLVLASRSPRRSEILRQAGIPFVVRAAEVDETPLAGESPEDYVRRVAELKALAVEAGVEEQVLGADTTVVIDGEMLGKPADAGDARRMLELLSGRRHEVLTGICLKRGGEVIRDWAATSVWFVAMRARGDRGIRGERRTDGQGGGVRDTGAGVEVHREDRRVLLQRGGATGIAGVRVFALKRKKPRF